MKWLFALTLLVAPVDDYVAVLKQQGQEPVSFIRQTLNQHDLIIFDDAIHSAQEPFDFYQTLLRDPQTRERIQYIFVEVFSLSDQPYLDAFFSNPTKDLAKLETVFQNDYSGYGWSYQTYIDLLSTIWDINKDRPASAKLQVIGVSPPIYWQAIHTRKDYEIFQESIVGRDYLMYLVMLEKLDHFRSGKKGFFLTNTRHAYKRLRKADGQFHWNCATFFDQHYPGKVFSIRFHNMTLSVEKILQPGASRTAEGLENVQFQWVRMEDGKWDEAFEKAGNRPTAIPLKDNAFGNAKYIGNLMLNVQDGQTMQDAYDAIILLKPMEQLHVSAKSGLPYTKSFQQELKRRIQILQGDRMEDFLRENGVKTLDELLQILSSGEPKKKSPYTK